MLNKKILLNKLNEAKENKAYLYITYEDKEIKFYTNEKISSDEFLKNHNLNYDKNLIVGLNPVDTLKYNYVIYKNDMDIDTFLQEVKKDYQIK